MKTNRAGRLVLFFFHSLKGSVYLIKQQLFGYIFLFYGRWMPSFVSLRLFECMQNPLLRAYILAHVLLRVGEDAGLIACILRTNIYRIAM